MVTCILLMVHVSEVTKRSPLVLTVHTLKLVYILLRSHHFDMLAILPTYTELIYGIDAAILLKYSH
jgi:hypothetical protein